MSKRRIEALPVAAIAEAAAASAASAATQSDAQSEQRAARRGQWIPATVNDPSAFHHPRYIFSNARVTDQLIADFVGVHRADGAALQKLNKTALDMTQTLRDKQRVQKYAQSLRAVKAELEADPHFFSLEGDLPLMQNDSFYLYQDTRDTIFPPTNASDIGFFCDATRIRSRREAWFVYLRDYFSADQIRAKEAMFHHVLMTLSWLGETEDFKTIGVCDAMGLLTTLPECTVFEAFLQLEAAGHYKREQRRTLFVLVATAIYGVHASIVLRWVHNMFTDGYKALDTDEAVLRPSDPGFKATRPTWCDNNKFNWQMWWCWDCLQPPLNGVNAYDNPEAHMIIARALGAFSFPWSASVWKTFTSRVESVVENEGLRFDIGWLHTQAAYVEHAMLDAPANAYFDASRQTMFTASAASAPAQDASIAQTHAPLRW